MYRSFYEIIQQCSILINSGSLIFRGTRYSTGIDFTTGTFDCQAFEAPVVKETFIASADIRIDAQKLGKKGLFIKTKKIREHNET